jgi:hypothetical protein
VTTLTPHALAALLTASARGFYATEAAARLLVGHWRWLERDDFRLACVNLDDEDGHPVAWVDWDTVPAFAEAAACSSTEAQVLRLCAELAGIDSGVALADLLGHLDDRNGPLVLDAIAHIALRGKERQR